MSDTKLFGQINQQVQKKLNYMEQELITNMTKARDLADIVSNLSANAEKAVVVNAGGTELTFGDAGSSDIYGFVKTNGTGTQKEDLVLHYTNGADNLSVSNNDTEQSDIFDESFVAKRGLTLAVNADGELTTTV